MKKNKNISVTQFKKFKWYNITSTTRKETNFLKKEFNFRDINLENCLPPLQRPKILRYPDYIFMILLFPYYDRKTKEIKISEVDFFISHKYIVMVHDNKLPPLIELDKKYNGSDYTNNAEFNQNPAIMLYEVIESLLSYCFPMLNHVGLDIDDVEEKIFNEFGESNVKDILLVKRNIINFRKAMQAHRTVMSKLQNYIKFFTNDENIGLYFEDSIEQTKDIWDLLENYKSTIEALYSSNESLVSLRLSEIMKMLTIISVLTFPLTLFVALFSTNLTGTPFADHPFGFWIIVGLILIGAFTMLYAFKSQRWL